MDLCYLSGRVCRLNCKVLRRHNGIIMDVWLWHSIGCGAFAGITDHIQHVMYNHTTALCILQKQTSERYYRYLFYSWMFLPVTICILFIHIIFGINNWSFACTHTLLCPIYIFIILVFYSHNIANSCTYMPIIYIHCTYCNCVHTVLS